MDTLQTISHSSNEKHAKTMAFMRAWAKRKQDRQEQIWKDYEEGKYDEWLVKLNQNEKSNV